MVYLRDRVNLMMTGLSSFQFETDLEPTSSVSYKSLIRRQNIKENLLIIDEPKLFLGLHSKTVYNKDGRIRKYDVESSVLTRVNRDKFLEIMTPPDIEDFDMFYKMWANEIPERDPSITNSDNFYRFVKKYDEYMILLHDTSLTRKRKNCIVSPMKEDIYDNFSNKFRNYFDRISSRIKDKQEFSKGPSA